MGDLLWCQEHGNAEDDQHGDDAAQLGKAEAVAVDRHRLCRLAAGAQLREPASRSDCRCGSP
jgi:hypothetical protein